MSVDKLLKDRLSSVVTLCSGRVHPIRVPQNSQVPVVTYQRVTAMRESAMSADPGYVHARFRVTMLDTTYSGVRAVASQVRSALQRWRTSTGTPEVEDTFFLMETDQETDRDASDRGVWSVVHDYMVHHRE
jgi:hypothetical protein